MSDSERQFLKMRGRNLALLILGKIKGVEVSISGLTSGFDLICSVGTGMFGVEVKQSVKISTMVRGDCRVRGAVAIALGKVAKVGSIPAFALIFDMSNDSGYFCWLNKPGDEPSSLIAQKEFVVEPISDESLRRAVRKIRDWYKL